MRRHDRVRLDDANILHIAEHKVVPEEAEQVTQNDPVDLEVQEVDGEERVMQLGTTDKGRILMVASTMRGNKIRVVTAYDAPRTWRRFYKATRI